VAPLRFQLPQFLNCGFLFYINAPVVDYRLRNVGSQAYSGTLYALNLMERDKVTAPWAREKAKGDVTTKCVWGSLI